MHLKTLIIAFTFLAVSCKEITTQQDQGASNGPVSFDLVQAKKENLRLKRASQLKRHLVKILGMNSNQLCLELGTIPCVDVAHKVSLGGLAAYESSQYELPKESTISAPMALDRFILSACTTRASLDIINPAQGVIFKNLDITDDGRITKDDNYYNSVQRLYNKAFLRDPTQADYQTMEDLYLDIYSSNPLGAGRNWAILSCYSVLSSLEFIFY